jgi:hypothetical protein
MPPNWDGPSALDPLDCTWGLFVRESADADARGDAGAAAAAVRRGDRGHAAKVVEDDAEGRAGKCAAAAPHEAPSLTAQ